MDIIMQDDPTQTPETPLQKALARWQIEGGAELTTSEKTNATSSNNEVAHLHMRIIALENVIISLLSAASEPQLEIVRQMADIILPRENATQHPLTLGAALQMNHLVDRSVHFRT